MYFKRSCRCIYIVKERLFSLLSCARQEDVTRGNRFDLQFVISVIQPFHLEGIRGEIVKMVNSVDFVHPISLIFNPLRVYYIKRVSESCHRVWETS